MLRPPSEASASSTVASDAAAVASARPGLPVDPTRLVAALRRGKRFVGVAVLGAAVAGGAIGKLAISKSYLASATVLWEPPPGEKPDTAREIATLADSVKLPSNLRRVRDRLSTPDSPEVLGKRLDVSLGEASLLLTVKARADSKEGAADLANAAVAVFVEAQQDIASSHHREVAASLRASLVVAEASTSEARRRYDDFRHEQGIGDLSLEMQSAIAGVAKLRLARDDARAELAAMRAKETELRLVEGRVPTQVVVSHTEQRPDVAQLADLTTDLARAKAVHTDDHPLVRSLTAEADALRKRTDVDPAFVTARTMGRNSVRDAISVQAEESSALRRAIERKSSVLDQLQVEAETRTTKLGLAQGEAARRLADVEAAEQHLGVLLRQLASADDDVRMVSSGFQIVSPAIAPERSEKGLGRIVAVVVPLLVSVLCLLAILLRELAGLRAKTAREVAFWASTPVRWSTSWPLPATSIAEIAELGRELASTVDGHARIVGVVPIEGGEVASRLAGILADRLRFRGRRVAEIALRAPGDEGGTVAEALESAPVRLGLRTLAARSDVVVATLPALHDREAYRVATSLIDVVILVVPSGELGFLAVAELRAALELPADRVRLVVTGVPAELLPKWGRAVGPHEAAAPPDAYEPSAFSPPPAAPSEAPPAPVAEPPAKKRRAPRGKKNGGLLPSPAE
jgi:uncharacterized protein involved in exopolysaccharide biosynthesis